MPGSSSALTESSPSAIGSEPASSLPFAFDRDVVCGIADGLLKSIVTLPGLLLSSVVS